MEKMRITTAKLKRVIGTGLILIAIFTALTIGLGKLEQYNTLQTLEQTIGKQTSNLNSLVTSKIVMEAKLNPTTESPAQQELTRMFDKLSLNNPNIAQTYIFGTELHSGTKTSTIALDSRVQKLFGDAGLKLGDMYDQPKEIVRSITRMQNKNNVVFSDIYKDNWGSWITILYPIKDVNGQTFAYLGIDSDAALVGGFWTNPIKNVGISLAIAMAMSLVANKIIPDVTKVRNVMAQRSNIIEFPVAVAADLRSTQRLDKQPIIENVPSSGFTKEIPIVDTIQIIPEVEKSVITKVIPIIYEPQIVVKEHVESIIEQKPLVSLLQQPTIRNEIRSFTAGTKKTKNTKAWTGYSQSYGNLHLNAA
jgi:hypothetical protein